MKPRTTETSTLLDRDVGTGITPRDCAIGPAVNDIEFGVVMHSRGWNETYILRSAAELKVLRESYLTALADLETEHEHAPPGMTEDDILASFAKQADELQACYLGKVRTFAAITKAKIAAANESIEFYLFDSSEEDQPLQ